MRAEESKQWRGTSNTQLTHSYINILAPEFYIYFK
jgi:hypothetical protein